MIGSSVKMTDGLKVNFLFSALLLPFLLFGCAKQADNPPAKPVPQPTAIEIMSPVVFDSLEVSREDIVNVLPESSRDPETINQIVDWHRESFAPVVIEPMESANEILTGTQIVKWLELNRYSSAEDAKTACERIESISQDIGQLAQTIDLRLAEKEEGLKAILGDVEDLTPLKESLPIYQLAAYSQQDLLLQAEMCQQISRAIALLPIETGEQQMELKNELIAFREKYKQWKEWRQNRPEK